MNSEKNTRRCKKCGRPFEDKNHGKGRPKLYCSNSCKTAFYLDTCNDLEKEIRLQKIRNKISRYKLILCLILFLAISFLLLDLASKLLD